MVPPEPCLTAGGSGGGLLCVCVLGVFSAISKGWTSCSEACANEWRSMTQAFGCCVTEKWGAQFAAKVTFQPRQNATGSSHHAA